MCGNLAAAHCLQGDFIRAEQLYERELDYLNRIGSPNKALVVQTRLALAGLAIQTREVSSEARPTLRTSLDHAIAHLEFVLIQAQAWLFEYPKASMKLAIDARMMIESSRLTGEPARRLTLLAQTFADLQSRIEPTDYSRQQHVLEQAEKCLQDHRYREAESHCRDLLDEQISGPIEPQVRRRYIEALAGQSRWVDAVREVEYWKQNPTAPRLYRQAIIDLIRNISVRCAAAFTAGDLAAATLLAAALDWPELDTFLSMGTEADQFAIRRARQLRDMLRQATHGR
jgi:hypothetical protein